MSNQVTRDSPGETVLLMGNEAIVRGALEAGIRIAASYTGTPASEIGNTLAEIAKEVGIHFEWSTNEKVAYEVAFGAAMGGVRALTAMKSAGASVAADPGSATRPLRSPIRCMARSCIVGR